MDNNLPQIQRGTGLNLNFNDPQTINTIRQTVAKKASDQELAMFLHLCNQYQLDPFRKEIWFIKYSNDPVILTSRDGYLKIAQQSPDFQGLSGQEVRENDYFESDPAEGKVVHRFAQPISNRGQIVGAWAIAYRRGVKPVSIFVNYEEYKGKMTDKNGKPSIWAKYPSSMIIKVAEAFVLKRQFGITGLVTREEMDASEREEWQQPSSQQQQPQQPPPEPKMELVPSAKDIEYLRNMLNWEPKQVSDYINALRHKYGQPPAAWKDLDATWKIKIHELLMKKLDKMMGI